MQATHRLPAVAVTPRRHVLAARRWQAAAFSSGPSKALYLSLGLKSLHKLSEVSEDRWGFLLHPEETSLLNTNHRWWIAPALAKC